MSEPTIRILSTRPLAGDLPDQGTARGIVIEALSFIETTPVIDTALTQRIRDLSAAPVTAVFTSMNAVEAVTHHLQHLRPHWRIFCIGAATRELVRDHFGEDRIADTAASAAALADKIIQTWSTETFSTHPAHSPEVFFFCGDQRRDELPDKLRRASIRVNEIVVYHTRPTPQKVQPVYDGIIFFSPSAVESFFSINTIPAGTVLFAIGATTAAAIHAHTPNRTIVGTAPEKETLIRQAIDYFQINNNICY